MPIDGFGGKRAPRHFFDRGARVASHCAGVARRDQSRRAGDGCRLRFQLRYHIVDFLARPAHLRLELFVQAVPERFFALAESILALVHPRFGGVQRFALARCEPLLVLERAHVPVDLGQMLGELRLARAQVLACRGDYRGVESESSRDLERETASRTSVKQLVGRGERVRDEAERRACDAVGRRRVRFQRVVVARGDDHRSAPAEVIDDRDAERAALDWIGARADFVEQHQRGRRERSIHRHDVADVRGKRAEARVDRLLVANVRKHRAKHRQTRSIARGDTKARLRHQRQESGSLECDRLAAGVRTRDEQHRRRRDHLDRDGHRVLHERMTRRLELEGAIGRERRLDSVDRIRKTRARLQHVEVGCRVDRALHVTAPRAERVGEREQNAPHFLGFLFFERDDVVVDLDGAERLEEQARAAGRRAVHDSRNVAAMLGLDHDDVSTVPLRDDLILQVFGRLFSAQVGLERAPQAGALFAQPFANRLQRRARGVEHFA